MPCRRPYPYKKQYSVSIDKETHDMMSKLSKDTGISRQQLAILMLNMVSNSLGNSLAVSALNQRERERELRIQWMQALGNHVRRTVNPDILAL